MVKRKGNIKIGKSLKKGEFREEKRAKQNGKEIKR